MTRQSSTFRVKRAVEFVETQFTEGNPSDEDVHVALVSWWSSSYKHKASLSYLQKAFSDKWANKLQIEKLVVFDGHIWIPLIDTISVTECRIMLSVWKAHRKDSSVDDRMPLELQQCIRDIRVGLLAVTQDAIGERCFSLGWKKMRHIKMVQAVFDACNIRITISLDRGFATMRGHVALTNWKAELHQLNPDVDVGHVERDMFTTISPVEPYIHKSFWDRKNRMIDLHLRMIIPFRWQDHEEVLCLFATLFEWVKTQTKSVGSKRAYQKQIRAFYRVCCQICPSGELIATLDSIGRDQIVEAACSLNSDWARKALYQFMAHGPWKKLLKWHTWAPISKREANIKQKKRERSRDVFIQDEINAMEQKAIDSGDHRSLALLTFFMHTAARLRAVARLQVRDVFEQPGMPRQMVRLLEKNEKVRWVRVKPKLGTILCTYLKHFPRPMDAQLFSGHGGVFEMDINMMWLSRLCGSCDPKIEGDHIHIHALRRTVITMLSKCGNSTEKISRWVGHENPATTRGYIEYTDDEVADLVEMPWTTGVMTSDVPSAEMLQAAFVANQASSSSSSSSSTAGTTSTDLNIQQYAILHKAYNELAAKYQHIMKNIMTDRERKAFHEWDARRQSREVADILSSDSSEDEKENTDEEDSDAD